MTEFGDTSGAHGTPLTVRHPGPFEWDVVLTSLALSGLTWWTWVTHGWQFGAFVAAVACVSWATLGRWVWLFVRWRRFVDEGIRRAGG